MKSHPNHPIRASFKQNPLLCKRITSLILALLLAVSLVPATALNAFADEPTLTNEGGAKQENGSLGDPIGEEGKTPVTEDEGVFEAPFDPEASEVTETPDVDATDEEAVEAFALGGDEMEALDGPASIVLQAQASGSLTICNKWNTDIDVSSGGPIAPGASNLIPVVNGQTITVSEAGSHGTFRQWIRNSDPFVQGVNCAITSMPAMSVFTTTSDGITAGDYFFQFFNSYGSIVSFPAGSFDTRNIINVGENFFHSFDKQSPLKALPEGSFNISKITSAKSRFFCCFMQGSRLKTLPEGSFNASRLKTFGNTFFTAFAGESKLESLPQSFSFPIAPESTDLYYCSNAFIDSPLSVGNASVPIYLAQNASDIFAGTSIPLVTPPVGSTVWVNGAPVLAIGWQQFSDGLWKYYPNSKPVADAWKAVGAYWYHFNKVGFMDTGTFKEGEAYYYLGGPNDGRMVTGWARHDNGWRYHDANGRHVTGWLADGGKWYYLEPENAGIMVAGATRDIGLDCYLFNASGQMFSGWAQFGGTSRSYFGPSGAAVKGWQNIDGSWYYFAEYPNAYTPLTPGRYATTGKHTIGDNDYIFADNNIMQTGWQKIDSTWYYCMPGSDGKVAKNKWLFYNGDWYYLASLGQMAKDRTQVGSNWYHLGTDGKMLTGWFNSGTTAAPIWRYYDTTSGAEASGWLSYNGNWYCFNSYIYLNQGFALNVMLTGNHRTTPLYGNNTLYYSDFDAAGRWIRYSNPQ